MKEIDAIRKKIEDDGLPAMTRLHTPHKATARSNW